LTSFKPHDFLIKEKKEGDFFNLPERRFQKARRVFKDHYTKYRIPIYNARAVFMLTRGKAVKIPLFLKAEVLGRHPRKGR
jgi:hypothetical protein